MNNFEKVIQKLERFGDDRPDPEDNLHNIARCVEGAELNEEEWCNFFRYITSQNKKDFEYVARDKIVTLGDLGDEELEKIQKEIGFGQGREVEWYQNGMETKLIVKNITNNNKEDNGKKPLVGSCTSLSSGPQRREFKKCPQGSLENIQERRGSEDDEKKQS